MPVWDGMRFGREHLIVFAGWLALSRRGASADVRCVGDERREPIQWLLGDARGDKTANNSLVCPKTLEMSTLPTNTMLVAMDYLGATRETKVLQEILCTTYSRFI